MRATELAAKFRHPGVLDFADTPDGLVKALVSTGGMSGELYLQGAHVTGWTPANGRPVLFTSPRSAFAPGKAIRGGVPIIFPWFGPNGKFPAAPQHGFSRAAPWQLDNIEQQSGGLSIQLSLSGGGDAFWPERFRAIYEITFGATLTLRLHVQNRESRPIVFEEALHTYFAVSDVEAVSVTGLDGRQFIDKVDGMRRKRQEAAVVLTAETDRVYLDTSAPLGIDDPGWQRRISIASEGAASAIVWNPWAEKSAAMGDLGAGVWRGFICVESGNVAENAVTLAADSEHAMTTEFAVSDAA